MSSRTSKPKNGVLANEEGSIYGLSPEPLFKDILELIGQDQTWQGKYMERCKDGKVVSLSACVFPLRDEHGTVVHAVWTVHGQPDAPGVQPV